MIYGPQIVVGTRCFKDISQPCLVFSTKKMPSRTSIKSRLQVAFKGIITKKHGRLLQDKSVCRIGAVNQWLRIGLNYRKIGG